MIKDQYPLSEGIGDGIRNFLSNLSPTNQAAGRREVMKLAKKMKADWLRFRGGQNVEPTTQSIVDFMGATYDVPEDDAKNVVHLALSIRRDDLSPKTVVSNQEMDQEQTQQPEQPSSEPNQAALNAQAPAEPQAASQINAGQQQAQQTQQANDSSVTMMSAPHGSQQTQQIKANPSRPAQPQKAPQRLTPQQQAAQKVRQGQQSPERKQSSQNVAQLRKRQQQKADLDKATKQQTIANNIKKTNDPQRRAQQMAAARAKAAVRRESFNPAKYYETRNFFEAAGERYGVIVEGQLPNELSSSQIDQILVTLAREAVRHFKRKPTTFDYRSNTNGGEAQKQITKSSKETKNNTFVKRVEDVLKASGMRQREFDEFWKENAGKKPEEINFHEISKETLQKIVTAFIALMKGN